MSFIFSIQSKNGDFWNCFVGELFLCQNKETINFTRGVYCKDRGTQSSINQVYFAKFITFLPCLVVPFPLCLFTNYRTLHSLKQVSWLSNSSHPAAKWWVMIPPKACCKWCRRRSKTPKKNLKHSRCFEGMNMKLSAKRLTLDTWRDKLGRWYGIVTWICRRFIVYIMCICLPSFQCMVSCWSCFMFDVQLCQQLVVISNNYRCWIDSTRQEKITAAGMESKMKTARFWAQMMDVLEMSHGWICHDLFRHKAIYSGPGFYQQ